VDGHNFPFESGRSIPFSARLGKKHGQLLKSPDTVKGQSVKIVSDNPVLAGVKPPRNSLEYREKLILYRTLWLNAIHGPPAGQPVPTAQSVTTTARSRVFPSHVAVIGAAGGLGQGILSVCRAEGIGFTAIVRSQPERIAELPHGSRVAVVTSLADRSALTGGFSGASAVLTALGVTATSQDKSALLSANMATVEESMLAAGVDRIIVINTLLVSLPGKPASQAMRFFSWVPGRVGRGAREQQAVADALGKGAFSSLRWTLVRAGVNSRGKDERPVASADWKGALNSWSPVSYEAMGRWMLEEAVANEFVRAAPLVSRRR
jgi:putative NADH-flavin reductase